MKQIPVASILWFTFISLWMLFQTGCGINKGKRQEVKVSGDIEFKENRERYVKAYLEALQAEHVHLKEGIEDLEDSEYDDYHLELLVVGSKKFERKSSSKEQSEMARQLGGILIRNLAYVRYFEDVNIGFLSASEWEGEEIDIYALDQFYKFPLNTWLESEDEFLEEEEDDRW